MEKVEIKGGGPGGRRLEVGSSSCIHGFAKQLTRRAMQVWRARLVGQLLYTPCQSTAACHTVLREETQHATRSKRHTPHPTSPFQALTSKSNSIFSCIFSFKPSCMLALLTLNQNVGAQTDDVR
jgi:hypothetical protein